MSLGENFKGAVLDALAYGSIAYGLQIATADIAHVQEEFGVSLEQAEAIESRENINVALGAGIAVGGISSMRRRREP